MIHDKDMKAIQQSVVLLINEIAKYSYAKNEPQPTHKDRIYIKK